MGQVAQKADGYAGRAAATAARGFGSSELLSQTRLRCGLVCLRLYKTNGSSTERGASIVDRSVASASALSTKGAPQTCWSTRGPAPPISVEPQPRTPRSPPSRAGHVFSRSASQPSVSAQRHKISPQATPRFLRATTPHPSLPCARASLSTRLRLSAERGRLSARAPPPCGRPRSCHSNRPGGQRRTAAKQKEGKRTSETSPPPPNFRVCWRSGARTAWRSGAAERAARACILDV